MNTVFALTPAAAASARALFTDTALMSRPIASAAPACAALMAPSPLPQA